MAKNNTGAEAPEETQEGDSAPTAKSSNRKMYKVSRLRQDMKGQIVAHDGSTGETISFDEGKPVALTPHMVAGIKEAAFQTTVLETDEKTGQERSVLTFKRSYSLEEA